MNLYSNLFFSSFHTEIADESHDLRRMLRFESTLAKVQADLDLIPRQASRLIQECAKVEYLDLDKLKMEIRLGGNAAIPLVQQLTRIVKNNLADASKYVHLGATSQDVIDTATVLEIQEWMQKMDEIMVNLGAVLQDSARKFESTVMIGRTLLQQAKPITFGLKLATYLEALQRHQVRLRELKKRVLCLQLSGAVGAGNEFISQQVGERMAQELELNYVGSWHTHRDSLVEWACYLANLSGFCGKIATDISLLMQTEVAEVFEGAAEGKGGSSTMPHKRNPVTCAIIIANSSRTPQLAATLLANMPQEHERSPGKWHAEWDTLKMLHLLSAGSLEKTLDLLSNLEVNSAQMAKNLELTNGLIYAENVSFALSKQYGKLQAHEMVEKACKQAIKSGVHLKEVCEKMQWNQIDLSALFSPENSIGNSRAMIQFIIEKYENSL
jgi:3-carboxy-cis,cis-muconate cycloisomerase